MTWKRSPTASTSPPFVRSARKPWTVPSKWRTGTGSASTASCNVQIRVAMNDQHRKHCAGKLFMLISLTSFVVQAPTHMFCRCIYSQKMLPAENAGGHDHLTYERVR